TAALFVGAMTAATVVAVRATAPATAGPHVSHMARPTLGDFLPPGLRWWPAISVVVTGVCVAAYALMGGASDPQLPTPGGAALAWTLGSLAVAANLALARWLAGRPPPAGSPPALAPRHEAPGDSPRGPVPLPAVP